MNDFPKIRQLIDLLKSKDKTLELRRDLLPIVEAVAKSDEIDELIRQIIIWEANPKTSTKTFEYRLTETGIILAQTEYYFLLFSTPAAGSYASGEYSLYYPSNRRIFVNYSNKEVIFKSYVRPLATAGNVFQVGQELAPAQDTSISQRQCHVFDEDKFIADFSSAQSVSHLSLVDNRGGGPLRWIFDPRTLKSVFWTIGDRHSSLLCSMINMLGHFGAEAPYDKSYIETLRRLSAHPFHLIRWTAIQAISAIDFEAAKPLLLDAVHDPHPDISNAAKRIVQRDL